MKIRLATEHALLGSLMFGPKHGYEILQFLDSGLGSTWSVGTSQLYTLLKRLERNGLLQSSLKTQESRPSKRVFSLTPAGKNAFLDWLHSTTENVRDLRIEFLAKLFFFHRLSLDGGDKLINAQVRILEKNKESLQQRDETEEDPYKRLVIDFKMATLETWLDWLIEQAEPFIKKVDKG